MWILSIFCQFINRVEMCVSTTRASYFLYINVQAKQGIYLCFKIVFNRKWLLFITKQPVTGRDFILTCYEFLKIIYVSINFVTDIISKYQWIFNMDNDFWLFLKHVSVIYAQNFNTAAKVIKTKSPKPCCSLRERLQSLFCGNPFSNKEADNWLNDKDKILPVRT